MQNTRLNTLVDITIGQLGRWFSNPWRRLSLQVISLLFGFYLGTAIATTTGQRANLDILVALILVILNEALSWLFYRNIGGTPRPLWLETINGLRVGIIYSLAVEAFKLGS